jgi:hypothetical protein
MYEPGLDLGGVSVVLNQLRRLSAPRARPANPLGPADGGRGAVEACTRGRRPMSWTRTRRAVSSVPASPTSESCDATELLPMRSGLRRGGGRSGE